MSNKRRKVRVLVADDESAIVRIYSIGLQHYFARDPRPSGSEHGSIPDGDAQDDRPSAAITVCQQGAEAIELVREARDQGAPFDVVVLDIRMPPGMSGLDAALQIREFDQQVPILFVSGFSEYSLSELRDKVPPSSLVDLIEKPVQLAQLAVKIKQLAG